MKEIEFTLKFSLQVISSSPDYHIERLAENGCDDALIGVGQTGRIALQFNREADNALSAVFSAIKDVKKAIPMAVLIEATPDIVGLSDIAEALGCSRQNIRKLMLSNSTSFPIPIHEGKSAIWHLSSVLTWFRKEKHYAINESLLDVAKANMQLNIAKESSNLDPSIHAEICEFLP